MATVFKSDGSILRVAAVPVGEQPFAPPASTHRTPNEVSSGSPDLSRKPDAEAAPTPASWRERWGGAVRRGIFFGLLLASALGGALFHLSRNRVANARMVPFVLRTDPPAAEVLLDDQHLGATSETGRLVIQLDAANPDVRSLEVRHPGHEPARRALSAYSGLPGTEIALRRRPVELAVHSLPTAAEVWVDDELRGFTPLVARVLPNKDRPPRIRVARTGFRPVEREMTLALGDAAARLDVRLSPAPPRLEVTTEPTGALVRMDGRTLGAGPVSIDLDESTRGTQVVLEAEVPRFVTLRRPVEIPEKPGEPIRVHLELRPAPTCLEITTDPPGARVTVNGRPAGVAPLTCTLTDAESRNPVAIEALLPGVSAGRQTLPAVEPSTTTRVSVPLRLYARRVALALDCAVNRFEDFEVLRALAKERVHRLQREQSFILVARVDGRLLVGPEGDFVVATFEQKVRAYDRLHALRAVTGAADGDVTDVLRAALALRPDSVWLFTQNSVSQDAWSAATEPEKARDATIQVVTSSRLTAAEWLAEWLQNHRGWFDSPSDALSRTEPQHDGAESPGG